MRIWLQWLAIVVTGAAAIAVFGYLINCGPRLVAQQGPEPTAEQMPVPTPSRPDKTDTIRLGWTAWADAEVVTLMAEKLLERHFGYQVDRIMTDIGIQYQAVANGDLDVMLMAWLPVTHANYWEKVRGNVVNLGPIYMGRLGWAVPAYVPEEQLASLSDLTKPGVAEKIGRSIQGIDPGSGLMQASEKAMEAYKLDKLKLVSASGAAMTAVLDRAIRNDRWAVVTAWQPHWIFARYDLRFLQDPKGLLGGEERVCALVREGFQEDFPPEVTGFLSRMYIPEEELAHILLDTQTEPVDDAVERYINEHPGRIRYWLTGKIEEGQGQM